MEEHLKRLADIAELLALQEQSVPGGCPITKVHLSLFLSQLRYKVRRGQRNWERFRSEHLSKVQPEIIDQLLELEPVVKAALDQSEQNINRDDCSEQFSGCVSEAAGMAIAIAELPLRQGEIAQQISKDIRREWHGIPLSDRAVMSIAQAYAHVDHLREQPRDQSHG